MRSAVVNGTYSPDELTGLPVPVQRYFRTVLTEGQRVISTVEIHQTGSINMSATGEKWKPFTATQSVTVQRPGFDWDARVRMLPGISVRVHDAYIAGEGILRATLFGLVNLASQRGTPEMARGELLRFFAEAAWYPTALLPGQGVRWRAVDETSAEATLRDGNTEAVLLFRFGGDGLIESVRANARGRTLGETVIPTPWEGRWSRYEVHDGMRVPMQGEVAWVVNGEAKTYWRGTITSVRYEFV